MQAMHFRANHVIPKANTTRIQAGGSGERGVFFVHADLRASSRSYRSTVTPCCSISTATPVDIRGLNLNRSGGRISRSRWKGAFRMTFISSAEGDHVRTASPLLEAEAPMQGTFHADGVNLGRGFLPIQDPTDSMGSEEDLKPWEKAMQDIPRLSVASGSGRLRRSLTELPPFPMHLFETMGEAEQWRTYMTLSFLAHAYMWCESGDEVPQILPARLAVPWSAVSKALDMPPVLVYATYNLLNWRRIDPQGPIELGNIVCLNNFLGGPDEEHFRLVHVDIEAKAGPALAMLGRMQQAALKGDEDGLVLGLQAITASLQAMQTTLSCMGEKCDPYIYYHRVRLPMSGWKSNPALPQGLIYEGVSDVPVQLYGETGAQSSIVPAFDAALGIEHEEDWLKAYLSAMALHMPPQHRSYVEQLRSAPRGVNGGVRELCKTRGGRLKEVYNEAVQELERFRSQHKAFAFNYIAKFSIKQSEERGTGGSDFMPALGGYRDTTAKHLL